ncbi:uncharacterized protein LOC125420089 [Ziziphus jujuba]|uniref:Uncharacterized protein LOC125420089 n=1 Tax=Ziziphus jujuba TaxID=326968 RepID=A0ABM3I7X1_ZIZJJ|nr:uncharacterized protein LOC125420089 [Ziziphus jujuba]
MLWFSSPWNIKWESLAHLSVEEKLHLLANPIGFLPVHFSDKEDFFLYAARLLDQLWKIRNAVKMENSAFSIEKTMIMLRHMFSEFKLTLSKESIAGTDCHYRRDLWIQPSSHFIKINTDAAVKDGICFIGIIARDHSSSVLAIKSAQLQTDLPEVAEAYGVLQGLLLAKERGWRQIWTESDARNVILRLENHHRCYTHWMSDGIIADIINLKKEFQNVTFRWIPREANFIAHFVSRWCFSINFVGSIPIDSLPGIFPSFVTQEIGLLVNSRL